MKAFGLYVGACAVLIAIVGGVALWVVNPGARQTVVVSAALALVVQAATFLVARRIVPQNLMLGWGLGSLIRLLAVVLYALVVAKLWRASLTPALLSFVGFLFVTMVIEPLFLKR
jgi:hypothetical protein